MKKLFYRLINNEVVLYLIAGVAATLVYMVTRMGLFLFIPSILLVTLLANAVAILFAFWTNDRFVFKQAREVGLSDWSSLYLPASRPWSWIWL